MRGLPGEADPDFAPLNPGYLLHPAG
jgi:hypothetical protein